MKILFILSSRYPTEKAYGVTTRYTAQALKELGNEVDILSPTSSGLDDSRTNVIGIESKTLRFLYRRLVSKRKVAGFIFFLIFRLALLRGICLTIRKVEPKVLWLRDELITYLLQIFYNRRIQYVLEVHQTPNKFSQFLYKRLGKNPNVILAALTPRLAGELERLSENSSVLVAPVSVPEYFFDYTRHSKRNTSTFPIVLYLGKATSSGHDNNLELLLRAKSISRNNDCRYLLRFVGLEVDFIASLGSLAQDLSIPSAEVDFVGHQPHSEILYFMDDASAAIIPYPHSNYHRDRFPIKLVEYAARRIPLIISDTEAHRDITLPNMAHFFDPDSPESLATVISEVLRDDALIREYAKNAYDWSLGYSYTNRVAPIVDELTTIR